MADTEPQPQRAALTKAMRGTGGTIRVKLLGAKTWRWSDIYHFLMQLSWPRLILVFVGSFLVFNLLFAAFYTLDANGIDWGGSRIDAPAYWRNFFFSIDTVATIGYGNMYPVSVASNMLVVVEITFGILFFALVTGIAFARFSRPTARVLFSNVAVVDEVGGTPTLMFRAANQRHNLVLEARAAVSLLADEEFDGRQLRRFRDLKMVRDSTPVFALTWTMMHEIGPDSPLAGWAGPDSVPADAEIVVLLSGLDERSGQTIHARWAYQPDDIRWGARLVDIIGLLPDGTRTVDYRRFHDFEMVA